MAEWIWPIPRHPDGRPPVISSGWGAARGATSAAPAHSHRGADIMYKRPHYVSASVYESDSGSKGYELPRGTSVLAARAGVVKTVGTTSLGTHIIVDHGDDFSTFYQHLERADVRKGDHVEQGKAMGIAGRGSIGSIRHLHFEIRKNGSAFNPESWLATWPTVDAPGGGFFLKLALAGLLAWGALKVLK